MPYKDKAKANECAKLNKRRYREANKAKGLRCDGVPMQVVEPRLCVECNEGFTPVRCSDFCSKACRQKASRRKQFQRDPEAKARDRDRRSKYKNKRLKEDPAYRVKQNLRIRLARMASRKENPQRGSHIEMLGCPTEFFLKYIEDLWTEGMSWSNYGNTMDAWSLDHIKPLSSFDLLDESQLRMCCHYTNLQPMWHRENIRKGDDESWMDC